MKIHSRIWVCNCCMLSISNGECCEGHNANNGEAFTTTVHYSAHFYAGTDEITTPAVWGLWDSMEYDVSMGGEHADGCPNGPDSPTRGEQDCDCEIIPFSDTPCEGCGSTLHGERHAFTVFKRRVACLVDVCSTHDPEGYARVYL